MRLYDIILYNTMWKIYIYVYIFIYRGPIGTQRCFIVSPEDGSCNDDTVMGRCVTTPESLPVIQSGLRKWEIVGRSTNNIFNYEPCCSQTPLKQLLVTFHGFRWWNNTRTHPNFWYLGTYQVLREIRSSWYLRFGGINFHENTMNIHMWSRDFFWPFHCFVDNIPTSHLWKTNAGTISNGLYKHILFGWGIRGSWMLQIHQSKFR